MSYFLDIDEMPLYNWRKCKAGDYTYCRNGHGEHSEHGDKDAWEKVYNSYITRFGFTKKTKIYYEKLQLHTRLLIEYATTGDRFLLNEISVIESELAKFRSEKENFDEMVVHVSKYMGGGFINEKETTVLQYYTALNEMIESYGKKN